MNELFVIFEASVLMIAWWRLLEVERTVTQVRRVTPWQLPDLIRRLRAERVVCEVAIWVSFVAVVVQESLCLFSGGGPY